MKSYDHLSTLFFSDFFVSFGGASATRRHGLTKPIFGFCTSQSSRAKGPYIGMKSDSLYKCVMNFQPIPEKLALVFIIPP